MEKQTSQAASRFVAQEWRPESIVSIHDLPADSVAPALAMWSHLEEQSRIDHGWTFFSCREDDPDTANILNLWACGMARVRTVFNGVDGSPAFYVARPA
jgi:hypothetical protein